MSQSEAVRQATIWEAMYEVVYECVPGDAPCLILADMLEEAGRAEEAALLRAGRPAMFDRSGTHEERLRNPRLMPASFEVHCYPEADFDPFGELGPRLGGKLIEEGGAAVMVADDGRRLTAADLAGVGLENSRSQQGVGQLIALAKKQGLIING